ncbi:PRC-barrel domain-containing protein [Bosea sp. BK604]|uniref:PRC-barrel domain-containing protein n=1 Tax=Bosea sp. BK604 TaxID=2512180 RepID=UPI0010E8362B|nr:PRC-barrel domain-containing protein [Bosea sp. BK604]TCR66522.1 sporulation protein YlmC with PRC-barrel domain [Bosea sp. BK604]
MLKRHIALTAVGAAFIAATAVAQTSAPSPSPPSAAPAAPPAATESTKPPEQNLAAPGKWRASKLMGVDIYGADDKKVGDVTEVVFDKGGKIETVTVGVGGFLGLGSKDVAIPFEQITWSDEPMVQAAPAPAPSGGSGSMSASPTPPSGASAPKGPTMYPDHGKITMTKEQLTSAPAVTYAAR